MSSKTIGLLLIIFGIVLLIATALYAVFGASVSGTIVDNSSGKPLKAKIEIGSKIINTGDNGRFTYRGLPGEIMLKIAAADHGELKWKVSLKFVTNKDLGEIGLTDNVVLRGNIIENAVSPVSLKNVKLTVGKKSFKVDGDKFEVAGIELGEQTVIIEAEGHEPFERTGNIKKGSNSMTVALSLTPEEAMRRWFEAEQAGDFKKAYKYAHPDMASIFNRAAYIKDREDSIEKGIVLDSLKAGDAKIISEWTLFLNNKTYKEAAEIDTLMMFKGKAKQASAGESADPNKVEGSSHLVKVEGRWKIFPQPYGD